MQEDVLEFQFVPRGTKGDVRVTWSEATPEVARAWIDRTALTLEFGEFACASPDRSGFRARLKDGNAE